MAINCEKASLIIYDTEQEKQMLFQQYKEFKNFSYVTAQTLTLSRKKHIQAKEISLISC